MSKTRRVVGPCKCCSGVDCDCCVTGTVLDEFDPTVQRCCFDKDQRPTLTRMTFYYRRWEIEGGEGELCEGGTCAGSTWWQKYVLTPTSPSQPSIYCYPYWSVNYELFEQFPSGCSPDIPSAGWFLAGSGTGIISYSSSSGQAPASNIACWRIQWDGSLRHDETYINCCSGNGKSRIFSGNVGWGPPYDEGNWCEKAQYILETEWDETTSQCDQENIDICEEEPEVEP